MLFARAAPENPIGALRNQHELSGRSGDGDGSGGGAYSFETSSLMIRKLNGASESTAAGARPAAKPAKAPAGAAAPAAAVDRGQAQGRMAHAPQWQIAPVTPYQRRRGIR